MMGFTDLHSHFVYGVDDGARTRADMEAMLDAAYADGIVSMFATPHITPVYSRSISSYITITWKKRAITVIGGAIRSICTQGRKSYILLRSSVMRWSMICQLWLTRIMC